MAVWQTPKTDWEIKPVDENGRYNGDWLNVSDYDRITGNIEALAELANTLYIPFSIVAMEEKTVTDFAYASDFNNIEKNLDIIVTNSWTPPDYTGPREWVANGYTPSVDDLNRIEGISLVVYETLQRENENKPKLAFELKGSEF